MFSVFHLSKVFDMGEEEHDIILQKVQAAKVTYFVRRWSVRCWITCHNETVDMTRSFHVRTYQL